MIRRTSSLSHAAVAAAVLAMTGLAGFGVIGGQDQAALRPEHFDAKQVTVQPTGVDGVRVREVIDIDFGVYERRGYQRRIPNDFGVADDVIAFSPDANDQVDVSDFGSDTRIRIGNPNVSFTGQHRYELEYTLPNAQLSSGVLALDIIGNDETFTTDRFEVVLSGFELTDLRCDTGDRNNVGGCEFTRNSDGEYVTVIEPLEPGEGITVGGTVVSTEAVSFGAAPPLSGRNPSGFRPLGLAVFPLCAAAAVAVFLTSRRYGSNEVHGAGGAADAAYGDLPAPSDPSLDPGVSTSRVTDRRLADLATIEFVPPRGIEPWQATALLTERVDDDTVSAWFSDMIARGAIEVIGDDKLRRGDGAADLNAADLAHLDRLFKSDASIKLGEYDSGFSTAWTAIREQQVKFLKVAGWWNRGAPGTSAVDWRKMGLLLFSMVFIVMIGVRAVGAAGANLLTAISDPILAVAFAMMLTGAIAFLAYRSLLPSRSATGSALTLRSESFRRFLAASEGRHVEWAWENNLVREYSAWAVALGAADAWKRAIESSNIPHPEQLLNGPMLLYGSASSFRSAHTPPSSSGSGGNGGGFSGGGVGGGGGGGSSGSW